MTADASSLRAQRSNPAGSTAHCDSEYQLMPCALDDDAFEIVTAESLERELEWVRTAAAGPDAGIFGPHSISWRVDRKAALFLGAGRALLLQLAHPWVAAAIEQHSDTFENSLGR